MKVTSRDLKTAKRTTTKAAKPSTKKATVKDSAAKKAAAAIKVYAHYAKGSTPFTGIPNRSTVKGALLLSALIASGMARLNKGSSISTTGKGNRDAFTRLVGPTPYNQHKKDGKFEDGVLTKEGAAFFSKRMDGTAPTYNTDRDTVEQIAVAMQKGGTVNGVEFAREIVI